MPSWAIHLKVAKELAKDMSEDEYQHFLLGNLLPDVNVGYLINPISKKIPYSITHYGKMETYDGKTREFPDYEGFIQKYAKEIKEPIMLGYLAHLATDFYWNYQVYIQKGIYQNGKMIGIKGKENIIFGEGELLRQTKVGDFNSFSYYLYHNHLVPIPNFKEDLIKGTQKVNEIHIENIDIKGVNQYFQNISEKIKRESKVFKIFSLAEMEQDLKENVEFIQNIFSSCKESIPSISKSSAFRFF